MPEIVTLDVANNKVDAPNGSLRNLGSGLLKYGSIAAFRAAAPLPLNAQLLIDKTVVGVGLERLALAAEVMSAGLTYPLSNWLSVPSLYWETEGKVGQAIITMTPKARGENQRPARTGHYLPIPCIMDDFQLGIRDLMAAERAGMPLDTSGIAQATRRVNERIEELYIRGLTDEKNQVINVGGNPIYGLLTAPNANTQAYVGGVAWDNAAKTGKLIIDDLLLMIAKNEAANHFGPYALVTGTKYGNILNRYYSDGVTTFPKTNRATIEEMSYGGRGIKVVVSDRMPDDYAVLVQMTSDVIEGVIGQAPTVVSWEDGPGWERNFVVLACNIPRVRSDGGSQSGICIGYTS